MPDNNDMNFDEFERQMQTDFNRRSACDSSQKTVDKPPPTKVKAGGMENSTEDPSGMVLLVMSALYFTVATVSCVKEYSGIIMPVVMMACQLLFGLYFSLVLNLIDKKIRSHWTKAGVVLFALAMTAYYCAILSPWKEGGSVTFVQTLKQGHVQEYKHPFALPWTKIDCLPPIGKTNPLYMTIVVGKDIVLDPVKVVVVVETKYDLSCDLKWLKETYTEPYAAAQKLAEDWEVKFTRHYSQVFGEKGCGFSCPLNTRFSSPEPRQIAMLREKVKKTVLQGTAGIKVSEVTFPAIASSETGRPY